MTAVRFASAIRRAVVVIACLIVGQAVGKLELGATAAVAALLTGLLDTGDSIRVTARTMGCSAVVMAASITIASLIHPIPVLSYALVVILAFATGIAFGVNAVASTICYFAVVVAVQYLLQPSTPGTTWQVGLAALLGAGIQALAVFAAEPFVGEMPERRRSAYALVAVAESAIGFGKFDDDEILANNQKTSAALSAAEQYIRRSDIEGDKRDHYRHLLHCVEIVRLELGGLATVERLDFADGTDATTRRSIKQIGQALDQAATTLTSSRRGQQDALAELDRQVEELRLHHQDATMHPAVAMALDSMSELDLSVAVVIGHRRTRRPGRPPQQTSVETRLRDAFSPSGDPLRLALRLVVAVLVAELVANRLGLVHGSWTAVTAMSMLRPAAGATLPRIVHRAVGTTVGVTIVLGYVWLFGGTFVTFLVGIALLAFVCFALGKVNYFFYVVTAAPAFVLLLSISGNNPIELAEARWVDVLIGCVLAVVLALLFPIWRVRQLPVDVGSYASAVSDYLRMIGRHISADGTTTNLDDVRGAARKSRLARQAVNARLSAAFVEPPHRNINLSVLSAVVARTHRTAESSVAAEAMLRHGDPAGAYAGQYVEQAVADMQATASAVISSPSATDDSEVAIVSVTHEDPGEPESDRTGVSRALRNAARNAHLARLAASPRQESDGTD